jgi:hypothetical protein
MDILNKLKIFTLDDSTCTGDIATNKAKGEIDIIGKPKKKKKGEEEEENE